jgi:hypothetical protein
MKKTASKAKSMAVIILMMLSCFTFLTYLSDNVLAASNPTVSTNATTGLLIFNATLRGYLSNDGGALCRVGFQYGLTTGYGTNVDLPPPMGFKQGTVSYGGVITCLDGNSTYVYAGGFTTNTVRLYWKSNMTYKTQTASYGGTLYALTSDDTYIYAGGGTTNKVYQYWKSNMTKKAETAAYGGIIYALAQDTTYVYAGGDTTNKVFQYWKSNMTKKAETVTYGGFVRAIAVNDTYVYVGGDSTNKVSQYWKSNMTYKTQTADYGGSIYALTSDDTYIYAGGGTTNRVRQYWKSNMTYKTQAASYGDLIYALTSDGTYVYAGGSTTNTIRQYWNSNMTMKAESSSYGGTIRALTKDTLYIYAGGASPYTVRQYIIDYDKNSPYAFSYNLQSLTADKTYHYRAYAINSNGTSYGSDQMFKTLSYDSTFFESATNTTWYIREFSSGSGNWAVPSNVSTVDVLVVGGGGGSGRRDGTTTTRMGGGGGAGGLIWIQELSVTPNNNISYIVGAGGAGATGGTVPGSTGGKSVFGNLTAWGGGGAGSAQSRNGLAGGSGGGAGTYAASVGTGGAGNQTTQPGWSGLYGYGNWGGNSSYTGDGYTLGRGGGGAGGRPRYAWVSIYGGGASMDFSKYFGTSYGYNGLFSGGGTGGNVGAGPSGYNCGYGGNANGANSRAGDAGDILIRWAVVSNAEPKDDEKNQDSSFVWSCIIGNEANGTFNWTIKCSNGQTNSSNNDVRGKKNLSLSGLNFDSTYTVWVNVTCGSIVNHSVFTFDTLKTYIDGSGVVWRMAKLNTSDRYSTWKVPYYATKIDVLVVGGGGGAGKGNTHPSVNSGGGGGGGLIWKQNIEVTPNSYLSYSVGGGGLGGVNGGAGALMGLNGGNTVFGNLTAVGGGAGGAGDANQNGIAGGSGGGAGANFAVLGTGGTATQPSQSGWSGTYGHGYNGGNSAANTGAGGGGAGGTGSGTTGGAGINYSAYFGMAYGIKGVFAKGGNAHSSTANPTTSNTGYGGYGRSTTDGGDGRTGDSGLLLIRWGPRIELTSPQNNSLLERQSYANLTIETIDIEPPLNITFYNASDDSILVRYLNRTNGVHYYNWTGLTPAVRKYWYVIVNGYQSATWNFMPNDEPTVKNLRIETINQNNITVSWENELNMEWISLRIGNQFQEVRKILGVYQTWFVPSLFKDQQYNFLWQLGDNTTAMSDYYNFDFRTSGWKPDLTNYSYRKLITIDNTTVGGNDLENYALNLELTDDNFQTGVENWWDPVYPGFTHMNYTSQNDFRFVNYYETNYLPFNITSWDVPGDGGIDTQGLPNESYYNGSFVDPSFAHDGDWLTKTTPTPYGILYYNYTMPVGAKNTSKFRVYQGEWIWDVTLPEGAFAGSELRFRSICEYDTPYINTTVWDYDTSSWVLVQNDTARYFYESQIGWEYDAEVQIKVMPEHFNDIERGYTYGIDANYPVKFWMYYGNPSAVNNESTLAYSGASDASFSLDDEDEYEVNPPTISDVQETNVTATSINISWVTDEIANGRIRYATNPWFFGYTWAHSNVNKTEVFEHFLGNESHTEQLYVYSPYYVATVDVNCTHYAFSNNHAYYWINHSTGDYPAEITFNSTGLDEFFNWTVTYTYNKTIEWTTYGPGFKISGLPTNTKYYYQILAIGEGGNTTYDGDFTLGTLPSTPHGTIVGYDEDRPNETVTIRGSLTDMDGEPSVNCSIQYWNESSTDFSETTKAWMNSTGLFNKTITVDYGHTYYYRIKMESDIGYSDVYSNEYMTIQEFFAGNYTEDEDNNEANPDYREREYRPTYPNGTVNLSAKAYTQYGYWEGSLQEEDWMWVETNITDKGNLTLHLYTKEHGHVGDYALINDTDSDMRYIELTGLNTSWYTFYITGAGGQMVLNWTKPSLTHKEHNSRLDESKYVSFNATKTPVNYTLLYMDTQFTNQSAYRWSIASGLDLYSAMAVEYWGGGIETGLTETNVGTAYDRGQLFRGGVWNGEPYDTGSLETTRNNKPMGANRYCFAFTTYWWNASILPSNNITNYYVRYWAMNSHWSEYLGYYQDRLFDYIYLEQFKYDTISFTRDWGAIDGTTIYAEKRVNNVSADVFNTTGDQSLIVAYKSGFNFDPSNDQIWNFGLYTDGRWTNQQIGQYQQAFIAFNLPDNTTLQAMDSDSDNISDYNELFVYYTNPKSSDTDEDYFNDSMEITADTDPNNYQDFPDTLEITIVQPYEGQTLALDTNISTQTTITTIFTADYNISIWTSEGTLIEVLSSNTTPVGGDTINVSWNSTGNAPGNYVLKVNATDVSGTLYATRNFTLQAFTIKHITITATPAGTLDIVVDPNIWDGGGAAIGENYSTSLDTFTLENIGTVYADVTVEATDSTTWSLSTAPAHNKFQLQWNQGYDWYNLQLTPALFLDALPCGSTQQFGLKIFMPTSSSTNQNQTIVITFRATAN